MSAAAMMLTRHSPRALGSALVIALGAALHGAWIVSGLAYGMRHAMGVGACTTFALAFVLVSRIARASSDTRAMVETVVGSLVAGAANGVLAFMVCAALGEPPFAHSIELSLLAALFGAAIAIPFAIVLALPALYARGRVARRSRTDGLSLAMTLGSWLAVVALPIHFAMRGRIDVLPEVAGAIGAVATLVAMGAAVERARREAWLVSVRRGRVAGYAIVPASEVIAAAEVEPWSPGATDAEVLVRERDAPEGVYRGARMREAIAFVGRGA